MPRTCPRLQQGIQSIEVGNKLLVVLTDAPQPLTLKSWRTSRRCRLPRRIDIW